MMEKIIYWNSHETVLFAAEEARRLMRLGGIASSVGNQARFNEENDTKNPRIILILTDEYYQFSDEMIEIAADGFACIKKGNNLWIVGNEPRSILYGVYFYCKKRFGYQWLSLEEETMTNKQPVSIDEYYVHKPMFARRGNIFETINDPEYINSVIDWGVKNGHNEYFFTFFLWDQIKLYVAPELRKRNVNVTLGGHSLSYLLKEIQKDSNEEMPQEDRLKFFAENITLQDMVIKKIVAICMENEVISRLSLWPEDIGIDEKNAEGFLQTYMQFSERLKRAIEDEGLAVNVEYIVYNAGLSWNMLEMDTQTVVSDKVDALYAYWGRDYSTAIDASDPNQIRAYAALKDWRSQTAVKGTELTVLEYYSDHFMLAELFPPLLGRIRRDLQDYKKLSIDGILNLIVPIHKKEHTPSSYPWKWIHHFNNYIYARISWGENLEEIVEEYFSLFNEESALYQNRYTELEMLLSQQSKYNFPLFPARVVDPEKVDNKKEFADLSIPAYLREVKNLLSGWDLGDVETLIPLQTANNYSSFTTKEMTLIYFYYLKEVVDKQVESWSSTVST